MMHGVALGMATDNLINDCFEVVRGAIIIHPAHHLARIVIQPRNSLDMRITSGVPASGLDQLGTKEEGNPAVIVEGPLLCEGNAF
jgi:cytosine/adenosine deaminase-related metal-dependent hydrolase